MPLPRTEIQIFHHGKILLRSVLTPGEYIVGSDSPDLRVDCPGVAPHHARLSLSGHLLTVEDLGSEQGSFINNRRIEEPVRLFPNQKLKLGVEAELLAIRVRDDDEDPEASCSIQQAYVDRLLPPELRQRLKYEVNYEVARGGMGTVFCARETPIRREVAMKVMLSQSNESAVARFIKEAQVTGQLEHPNIVPIHELGVDEHDQLYYTMKYVRGITLKEALARLANGDPEALLQYPLPRLLSILDKVCDAVAFAHSRRIIHRDLKPENIMLGKFGEVLVMDWGLSAVLTDVKAPKTKDGNGTTIPDDLVSLLTAELPYANDSSLVGTPQYMAPEQARGEIRAIDTRCDIYALGAILFHILFLEKPIPGDGLEEVMENVRAGRTRLSAGEVSGKGLPHCGGQAPPVSLVAVVRKAMAPGLSDRYASVTELQADIRNYTAGFATEAEKAGIRRQLFLRLGRYRREAMWLAGFLVILAVVGGLALARLLQERRLAESALAELNANAPSFISQANLLAGQQRFDEAIEAVNYALRLQPKSVEAHMLKGDLLQAQLRLAEAAEAYREASQLQPSLELARLNAELSQRLAAREASEGKLSREALGELQEAMKKEGRLPALSFPISRLLGQENDVTRQFWEDRLNQLGDHGERNWGDRLKVQQDGKLSLDLSDTAISDLSPIAEMPVNILSLRNCPQFRELGSLRKMPIHILDLEGSGVRDLSPLKDLTLEELSLAKTDVADLSPLAGSTLRSLDCSGILATSFSVLAQTRLETLSLADTKVTDLLFLRGLPLRSLRLDGCKLARNYFALGALGNLEALTLREDFYDLPGGELSSLRGLSRQQRLRQVEAGAVPLSRLGKEDNAQAFWKEWDPVLAWLEVLRRNDKNKAVLLADGTWSVDLKEAGADDIGFLKGARISKLDLYGTAVADIKPLEGMPLEWLDLRQSKVTDLSPLRDMPLKELYLWENKVTDFTPISSLPNLEVLDLTQTSFSDLKLLRTKSMKLLRIGSTGVTSLEPLEGMSIEKLHCDNVKVPSVAPLLKCKGLIWLIPPAEATDIELLRGYPTLQRISYSFLEESKPAETVDEFWSSRKH